MNGFRHHELPSGALLRVDHQMMFPALRASALLNITPRSPRPRGRNGIKRGVEDSPTQPGKWRNARQRRYLLLRAYVLRPWKDNLAKVASKRSFRIVLPFGFNISRAVTPSPMPRCCTCKRLRPLLSSVVSRWIIRRLADPRGSVLLECRGQHLG